jgi:hypothetical protein
MPKSLRFAAAVVILGVASSQCGSTTPTQTQAPAPTTQTFTGALFATVPGNPLPLFDLQFQDATATLTGTMGAVATFTTIGDPNPLDAGVQVYITDTGCTPAMNITVGCHLLRQVLCEAGPPVKCPPITAEDSAPVVKGQTARVWISNTITPKNYTLTVTVHP